MRKLLFLLPLLLLATTGFAQNYIVGSFNLRYANPNDTGNLWSQREPIVVNLIQFHDFDILGTQEGLIDMLNDLNRDRKKYDRYGISRVNTKDAERNDSITI